MVYGNDGVYHTRAGGSYAVGTLIDQYLDEEDVKILYERWRDKWALPLEYPGSQYAITCDMIAEVPLDELVSVYGKKRSLRYIEAAQNAPTL